VIEEGRKEISWKMCKGPFFERFLSLTGMV